MKNNGWKNTIFRFLTAQTISLFGSSIVQYAIIWHITLTTSSGKMLTISTLCGFLPQLAISFFAGGLLDRYDRKKMIILFDFIIALSTLLLAICFIFGYTNVWLLFFVLAVRSVGTGIQTSAVNAIVPQIVPSQNLMKITGIQSTLSSIITFISPAISGFILSFAGLETTLFIDVITAFIGIAITFSVKINRYDKVSQDKLLPLQEFKNGFLYLKENRLIKFLLIFQFIILFLISPSAFLTPLMVSRTFGVEVLRLTASEMSYSLGMIIGGLIISFWGGFEKKLNTTLLAGSLYGIFMIALSAAPLFWIYLVFNSLIGVVSACYTPPIIVTIQQKVPQQMHGRIFSFMQISTSCALPFGMALFGPLADVIAIQKLLYIPGAIVFIICAIIFLTSFFEKLVSKR